MGGNSGIAKHTINYLKKNDISTLVISRKTFKNYIYNLDSIFKFIKKEKINFIINFVAITNNKECLQNYNKSFYINSLFPYKLGKFCLKNNISLIHLSSDFVFNGKKKNLSRINDPKLPSTFYGFTKLYSEYLLSKNFKTHIYRLPMTYGKYMKKNFIPLFTKQLIENKKTYVLSDRFFSPIHADDFIDYIFKTYLIKNKSINNFKINHCSSNKLISRYSFMKLIAKKIDKEKFLLPIKSKDLKIDILNSGLYSKFSFSNNTGLSEYLKKFI
tara:strand:+ start:1204 stop:2019 length:816 start_codon:yes stop_codon:yes gene_type:complete